jgi:hypothetical protein
LTQENGDIRTKGVLERFISLVMLASGDIGQGGEDY